MNKKGITLIALVITIIVLIIISSASVLILTDGSIIDRSRDISDQESLVEIKGTINTAVVVALKSNPKNAGELAEAVEDELTKIDGFGHAYIAYGDDDYVIVIDDLEITFEEATGKKIYLYIDSYVTRDVIEERSNV